MLQVNLGRPEDVGKLNEIEEEEGGDLVSGTMVKVDATHGKKGQGNGPSKREKMEPPTEMKKSAIGEPLIEETKAMRFKPKTPLKQRRTTQWKEARDTRELNPAKGKKVSTSVAAKTPPDFRCLRALPGWKALKVNGTPQWV